MADSTARCAHPTSDHRPAGAAWPTRSVDREELSGHRERHQTGNRMRIHPSHQRAATEPGDAVRQIEDAIRRRALAGEVMSAIAARMIDSWAPMPIPQSIVPRTANSARAPNPNSAKLADTTVENTNTVTPDRSNHRPKITAAIASTPMATAYNAGIHARLTVPARPK